MNKYEAAVKSNTHIIKKKIQALNINIKEKDIYHFHEHINYLTTELVSHGMIMPYPMQHLFKSCKVYKYSDFRDHLK